MKRYLSLVITVCILISITIIPADADGRKPTFNDRAMFRLNWALIEDSFTFVVWGDCRNDGGVFDDVMAKINEIDPVFSIGLGDYVGGGTKKEYDAFIPRLAALNQPLISVPGNHDYYSDGEETWLDVFGVGNFFFDFGGVRFISLDNADAVLDEDELAFLEKGLDTDLKKIVMAHAPPNYNRWSVHCFYKGSDKLLELIEEYEVDYAFFAHIHLYDELMIGDTQGIITGGAGAPLYGKFGFGIPETHVVKVTVTPGGISHEYIPVYE